MREAEDEGLKKTVPGSILNINDDGSSIQEGIMNTELLQKLPKPDGLDRTQLLNLLLSEEYGFLPPAPVSVTAGEEEEDRAFCAGKAVLKKLRLNCDTGNGIFSFPVTLMYPVWAGQPGKAEAGEKEGKPVPCFIYISFTDRIPDLSFPAEEILDNGFAVLHFCYQDVTSDDGDFANGLAGVIYPDGNREKTQCGKIGLWAWAASRVMDYAVTLPQIDHERVGIVGHSRLGKTALLAGALDERFFCTFANDSGCSGAALARGTKGETVGEIYGKFPFWFCENYGAWAEKEEAMPFDQHFLLAAIAPRRVYAAGASEDIWADPQSEYLSCIAADGYHRAAGQPGFLHPDRDPVPGDCFAQGSIGYHLRAGTHYLSRQDWGYFMEYMKRP